MGSTASTPVAALALPRSVRARLDPAALAAWTLAFALVAYLALSNGGYDTVVRSEVGIAIWWIVLLGCLAGVLPARIGPAGWVPIGLLAAFAAWTGLAIGWSESAERSAVELARVATYLGALVLVVALQGRTAARHTVNGMACAIGFVTVLAVLSRLHPQAFPANDHPAFLGVGADRRLSYPLNYWNGLAAFVAMGVPLVLGVAVAARTLAGQALAAATLPLSALCLFLTISRGGVLAAAVGLIVFFAVVPRRLDAFAALLAVATGSAILLAAASQRDALQEGAPTASALAQGTEMLWLVLIVCAGVAMVQVAIALTARHVRRPAWMTPSRPATFAGGVAVVLVALAVALAAGAPGAVSQGWHDFKAPYDPARVVATSQDDVFSKLQATNGNGRYEAWKAAVDAGATDRLKGIGPGTFEFWWARHGTSTLFLRDAHSLYLETLAEAGIIGLILLGGMLLSLLGIMVVRALRAPPGLRLWLAAAGGSLAAFVVGAGFDWLWELGAVAVAAMLLAGVIVAGREEKDGAPTAEDTPARRPAPRALLVVLALAALVAIVVPLAGTIATRDSTAAAASGRLGAALEDSRTAERLQPYAATPHLQRALVLEEAGDLAGAASAARAATADEPTNWRTWLVLSRIDALRGESAAALGELRRARELNPRSALFATP